MIAVLPPPLPSLLLQRLHLRDDLRHQCIDLWTCERWIGFGDVVKVVSQSFGSPSAMSDVGGRREAFALFLINLSINMIE